LLHKVGHLDDLPRYPGAERLAPARLKLETLPRGYVVQDVTDHTTDDLARVFGWYARRLSLLPDGDDGPTSNCRSLTKLDENWLIHHALAIHLCAQPGGTLIFVQRSLALRRPW